MLHNWGTTGVCIGLLTQTEIYIKMWKRPKKSSTQAILVTQQVTWTSYFFFFNAVLHFRAWNCVRAVSLPMRGVVGVFFFFFLNCSMKLKDYIAGLSMCGRRPLRVSVRVKTEDSAVWWDADLARSSTQPVRMWWLAQAVPLTTAGLCFRAC